MTQPPRLPNLTPSRTRYEVWERVELSCPLSGPTVEARLVGPQGRTFTIPAFPQNGVSRLRFVLPAPGRWSVVARSGALATAPLTLTAVAGKRDGFVQRAPRSSRYFQLSSGKPYFLIGENVCWSGSRGLADYDDWFAGLARAGGNFARLWMAFQPLETKEGGLGHFDEKNAAHFEGILERAETWGIRCMLCFMTYGELATGGYFNEGKWPESPYNAKNGGPVPAETPEAFFTEPRARAAYRNRLRYLVARYSAYTSLGFWEFWNEKDAPLPWLQEMARSLRSLDPYRHPITHSYSTTGPAEVWRLPELDLTQTHRYGDEGSIPDIAPLVVTDTRAHDPFQKPHLLGEFGISWRGPDSKFDVRGVGTNLHNGLWASALSGAAGGAAIWWWDSYVHPKNLYLHFTGLARFAAQIDWPRRSFEPLTLPSPRLPATGKETFRDLVLTPSGGWGDRPSPRTTIAPEGTVTGTLPGFLYGPGKPELHAPLVLEVDLRQPTRLVLRVLTVSDKATLEIRVDGNLTAAFPLNAAPGSNQDYVSTKQFPEYGGIYQALFDKDRTVALPAGKHRVTITNTEGDWVSLGSYTLTGAWSSRFLGLRTVALQDAVSGETLAWIQDPESHWKNDATGKEAQTFTGVRLSVPLPRPGVWRLTWWDTRLGKPLHHETHPVSQPRLELTIPPFQRDIALRITSQGKKS